MKIQYASDLHLEFADTGDTCGNIHLKLVETYSYLLETSDTWATRTIRIIRFGTGHLRTISKYLLSLATMSSISTLSWRA